MVASADGWFVELSARDQLCDRWGAIQRDRPYCDQREAGTDLGWRAAPVFADDGHRQPNRHE